MAEGYKQVVEAFQNLIENRSGFWGTSYGSFYVGISEDAKRRLKAHFVTDNYSYATVSSKTVAAAVELHFIDQGCDGKGGGGSPNANQVYIYKKTKDTKQ